MSQDMSQDIPQAYICPITFDLMNDPVSDSDGNSYEKTAIHQWILEHRTSPITRIPMSIHDLRPNRALKDIIDQYKTQNTNQSLIRNQIQLPDGLYFEILFDTSPSMDDSCSKNTSTSADTINYSKLDIAKHALKTFLHSLIEKDKVHYVSLVEFNSRATTIFDFVKITKLNLDILINKIDSLKTRGSTDIWDAFRVGIELIEKNKITNNVKILLLTDGETVNPENIIINIKTYLRIKPTINIDISTFGFGNDINSKLLYEISKYKNGLFGFMPDGTMLGTVFVNSISNLLSNDKKILSPEEDSVINKLIELLQSQLESPQSSCINLDKFCEKIINLKTNFIKDLLIDCMDNSNQNEGQIYKSIKPEYFRLWGKHYLYSVLSAFENKFCLNFKDKAIQYFKTDKFISYQNKINEIYIGLPPPQPTVSTYQDYNQVTFIRSAPVTSHQFSQQFYNGNGGCFVQGSKISIPNPGIIIKTNMIKVENVKKGMFVQTLQGFAKVVCVIKMKFSGRISTYKDSTQLTEYHPVFIKDQWVFPKMHPDFISEYIEDTYVYDYILESDHTVKFSNFYAPTFNHGITGDIIEHEYFGTNKIQNDLMKHPGWSTGFIELENYKYIRNNQNIVCGLQF